MAYFYQSVENTSFIKYREINKTKTQYMMEAKVLFHYIVPTDHHYVVIQHVGNLIISGYMMISMSLLTN